MKTFTLTDEQVIMLLLGLDEKIAYYQGMIRRTKGTGYADSDDGVQRECNWWQERLDKATQIVHLLQGGAPLVKADPLPDRPEINGYDAG